MGTLRRVAFALDIDGVLLHGKKPIEQAVEALALLGGQSSWRRPMVFLTNGGGVSEKLKARELEELLDLRAGIEESQVILAHTPFRRLHARRPDETRLVIGRGATLEVAREYWGTTDGIVTSRDLIRRAGNHMVPFSSHIDFGRTGFGSGSLPGSAGNAIESIWVFTDPSGDDWYHDLQVVLDTLLRAGAPVCGGRNERGRYGRGQTETTTGQPRLFIAQRDLLFSNGFHSPRLGLGAWVRCLETLYKSVTGNELTYECFGKPRPEVYAMAETSLREQAHALGWEQWGRDRALDCIMAVGDNASVDVRGANAAGWESSLVLTGVHEEGDALDASDTPTHVYRSILDVVRAHV